MLLSSYFQLFPLTFFMSGKIKIFIEEIKSDRHIWPVIGFVPYLTMCKRIALMNISFPALIRKS